MESWWLELNWEEKENFREKKNKKVIKVNETLVKKYGEKGK